MIMLVVLCILMPAFGQTAPTATNKVDKYIKDLKDTNPSVRQAAAIALGSIKDIRAIEPLILTLGDENDKVGMESAKALINLSEPAVMPLIQALNDESWHVRMMAAAALGDINDTRAVEPLVRALNDVNPGVRASVAFDLGHMRDMRAIDPLIQTLRRWSIPTPQAMLLTLSYTSENRL